MAHDFVATFLQELEVGAELDQRRVNIDAAHTGRAAHCGFENFELAHRLILWIEYIVRPPAAPPVDACQASRPR
jgi:hypothetical protein